MHEGKVMVDPAGLDAMVNVIGHFGTGAAPTAAGEAMTSLGAEVATTDYMEADDDPYTSAYDGSGELTGTEAYVSQANMVITRPVVRKMKVDQVASASTVFHRKAAVPVTPLPSGLHQLPDSV